MSAQTLTNPDGTKVQGCPAWWPFGTTKPTEHALPPSVRIPEPRVPISELPDALL